MLFKKLSEWVAWIGSIHVQEMDLRLERVTEVAKRLNILQANCPVVTVGGTNGKGSTAAGLEAIYREAGYRTGVFSSPILFRYNEYVRLNGEPVGDELFCQAFQKVETARQEITLTPFEFTALAAFIMFQQATLDIWILEVGLGGRYDAVNILDADVAIVTSIGIDHVEWLGDTREKIAYEKAGIFRKGKPAVCGDFDPPSTLIDYANQVGAPLYCQQQQFKFEKNKISWHWQSAQKQYTQLPLTKLALQNMSCVLMAVTLLQDRLPVQEEDIRMGLANAILTGRIQVIPGKITHVLDVSHNPASALMLAEWLKENKISGKTRAVFSMLTDKDIPATLEVIKNQIDEWHMASLEGKRSAPLSQLLTSAQQAQLTHVYSYETIAAAYDNALKQAVDGDRIIIFGSFHTVANVCNAAPTLNARA
jgi:dihydrofolate synthase/folylpolyglutamate synthase